MRNTFKTNNQFYNKFKLNYQNFLNLNQQEESLDFMGNKKYQNRSAKYFLDNPNIPNDNLDLTPIPKVAKKKENEIKDFKQIQKTAIAMRRMEYTHTYVPIKANNDKTSSNNMNNNQFNFTNQINSIPNTHITNNLAKNTIQSHQNTQSYFTKNTIQSQQNGQSNKNTIGSQNYSINRFQNSQIDKVNQIHQFSQSRIRQNIRRNNSINRSSMNSVNNQNLFSISSFGRSTIGKREMYSYFSKKKHIFFRTNLNQGPKMSYAVYCVYMIRILQRKFRARFCIKLIKTTRIQSVFRGYFFRKVFFVYKQIKERLILFIQKIKNTLILNFLRIKIIIKKDISISFISKVYWNPKKLIKLQDNIKHYLTTKKLNLIYCKRQCYCVKKNIEFNLSSLEKIQVKAIKFIEKMRSRKPREKGLFCEIKQKPLSKIILIQRFCRYIQAQNKPNPLIPKIASFKNNYFFSKKILIKKKKKTKVKKFKMYKKPLKYRPFLNRWCFTIKLIKMEDQVIFIQRKVKKFLAFRKVDIFYAPEIKEIKELPRGRKVKYYRIRLIYLQRKIKFFLYRINIKKNTKKKVILPKVKLTKKIITQKDKIMERLAKLRCSFDIELIKFFVVLCKKVRNCFVKRPFRALKDFVLYFGIHEIERRHSDSMEESIHFEIENTKEKDKEISKAISNVLEVKKEKKREVMFNLNNQIFAMRKSYQNSEEESSDPSKSEVQSPIINNMNINSNLNNSNVNNSNGSKENANTPSNKNNKSNLESSSEFDIQTKSHKTGKLPSRYVTFKDKSENSIQSESRYSWMESEESQ